MLVRRDGEYCQKCGVSGRDRQLVLDHKNNNSRDNRPENFQLLCRPCNYLKNPRRPENLSVSMGEFDSPTEIQINLTKEPMFKKFVAQQINELTYVEESDLINSGAESLGLSPITTKRYLNKMCSTAGIYERAKIGSTIVIRYKRDHNLT